jgi:hypothetical protein
MDDEDADDNSLADTDVVYQNIVYDEISNDVMSQEMEALDQVYDTCDLICQGLHFSGEFCRHNLVMCDVCGHIWDGFAQCTHPNL